MLASFGPSDDPQSASEGLSAQAEMILKQRRERDRVMAMLRLEEYIWDKHGPQHDDLHTDCLRIVGITLPGFTILA
jgi:hypothetical protein